jgi:hypothetical protein
MLMTIVVLDTVVFLHKRRGRRIDAGRYAPVLLMMKVVGMGVLVTGGSNGPCSLALAVASN